MVTSGCRVTCHSRRTRSFCLYLLQWEDPVPASAPSRGRKKGRGREDPERLSLAHSYHFIMRLYYWVYSLLLFLNLCPGNLQRCENLSYSQTKDELPPSNCKSLACQLTERSWKNGNTFLYHIMILKSISFWRAGVGFWI